jgi:hypothetical protein
MTPSWWAARGLSQHRLETMKCFLSVAVLLVAFQAVLGFMPAPVRSPVRAREVTMSAGKTDMKVQNVLAGLTPVIMSAPVWAAEGTGLVSRCGLTSNRYPHKGVNRIRGIAARVKALGVDDGRILPIVASIGVAFAFLFSTWSNSQDNEDFFDGKRIQSSDRLWGRPG